jgi:hypothetical protein
VFASRHVAAGPYQAKVTITCVRVRTGDPSRDDADAPGGSRSWTGMCLCRRWGLPAGSAPAMADRANPCWKCAPTPGSRGTTGAYATAALLADAAAQEFR